MPRQTWNSLSAFLLLAALIVSARAGTMYTTEVSLAVDAGASTTWDDAVTLYREDDTGYFYGNWEVVGNLEVTTITINGAVNFTNLSTIGTINAYEYYIDEHLFIGHSGNGLYHDYYSQKSGHLGSRWLDPVLFLDTIHCTTNTAYLYDIVLTDGFRSNVTLTTGTLSAEHLTSTDDATITDDLAVGGDIATTGWITSEATVEGEGVLVDVDDDFAIMDVISYSDTAAKMGAYRASHAGGVEGAPTATQADDALGGYQFRGYGSAWGVGAEIRATAPATWSGTADRPAYLSFYTASDAKTAKEHIRLTDEFFFIGSDENSAIMPGPYIGLFEVANEGLASIVALSHSTTGAFGGQLILAHNTNADYLTMGKLTTGQTIGKILAEGWTGGSGTQDFIPGAEIAFVAAANWGGDTTDAPTAIYFRVAADGSAALSNALRIDSDTDAEFYKDLNVVQDLVGGSVGSDAGVIAAAGAVTATYTGGAQFEAIYSGAVKATWTVGSGGDLTIAPSGDHLYIFDDIGEISGGNGVAFVVGNATTTTHFLFGQSSVSGLTGSHVYNATPANATEHINSLGYTTPLHIDASLVEVQGLFTGLANGPTVQVTNTNGGVGAYALTVKGCDETQDAAVVVKFNDANDADMGQIAWNATTNNLALTGSSDIVIKDQITTSTRDERARIMGTTLFKFHLKKRPEGSFQHGLIAQDLQKQFPELVMNRHTEKRLKQARPNLRGYTTMTAVVDVNYPTTHTETTWTSETVYIAAGPVVGDSDTTSSFSVDMTTATQWTSATLVETVDNWTTATELQHWIIDDTLQIDRTGLIEPMFGAIQQLTRQMRVQQKIIERQRVKGQQRDARMDALEARLEALEGE